MPRNAPQNGLTQNGPGQTELGTTDIGSRENRPTDAASRELASLERTRVKPAGRGSGNIAALNQTIIACNLCPRLIAHCKKVGEVKRRAYLEWDYWARPVPGFGDPNARLLILGLAPGAHGSNRTGRPFTGDGSGNFMYPILHKAGFASQPTATHREDGMRLIDAYITAAVRCAPPDNKPSPEEIANCAPYLDQEFAELKNVKVVVVLGKIAFDAYLNYLKRRGILKSKAGILFGHGETYKMPDGRTLLCSYHPSLQNTLTGKLTEKMFLDVFRKAQKLITR
jgi:uracil-DNA glycosylase family 4